MRPYFPSYVAIEWSRLWRGAPSRAPRRRLNRRPSCPFVLERRFSREEALEKIRARAYSSFVLMSDEEYEARLSTAAAGISAGVRYDLRILNCDSHGCC
jgi:hypothetical protein